MLLHHHQEVVKQWEKNYNSKGPNELGILKQ